MLERINGPEEVRKLSITELRVLAKEVRQRIIAVTSVTGGHIAPSLGATDIAVALLKVFDPGRDRIVWDVGHQSYAYKILTGRNDRFDTLRQMGGISGFNNVFESPYDAFGVGHSSTSISAALGIKTADDLQRRQGHAIAVIGDGSLTGGMSFEALNHAGSLQKRLIVVLNDNNMSISRNVGALQNYLAGMLASKSYNKLKKQVWDLSHKLPETTRRYFIRGAQKLEESLINILVPNIIFEDLGFKYIGPIDGHNMARLVEMFQNVRTNVVGPVLLHVITQKGKGYEFAENNARLFHGTGPFVEKTGEIACSSSPTYSRVFGDTLCELADADERIVAVTAAMTDGTGLDDFARRFPQRFFDVGIAEQHAVTFSAGMAIRGIKPFVAIYSTFIQRAYDQLIHDVALQRLPVVLCLDRSGLVGDDGPTHHGAFDLSFLNAVPNLTIMAPTCAEELTQMLRYAAVYQDGPIAIRYPRGCALYAHRELPPLEPGRFETVEPGLGVAIFGVGAALSDAAELRTLLMGKHDGLQPALINPRCVKPLDMEYLDSLRKTFSLIVTVEENALIGGFGSRLKDFFTGERLRVVSFGYPDHFIEHGKTAELKSKLGLTPAQMAEVVTPHILT
jgi:1-deoxy-D-xylulose-5-phosphate synthase